MAKTKPGAFDDPATRAAFVACVRAGNYRAVACRAVRASYASYKRFARKPTSEAAAFRAAIERAESAVETELVTSVTRMANAGNLQAAIWYLAVKFPARWGSQAKELREALTLLRELGEKRGGASA